MRRHRLLAVFGLFLLSPLVGEFLLGNTPITELPMLILLAPMYGGGALLVREVARRTGRGWPTMIVLAAAYALIEEGPIDELLWNPHYGGTDFGSVYAATHVAFLGTSVQLVLDVLMLHTIWSICVPIAIIETFGPGRARPWLGGPGLAVAAAVFVGGSMFLAGAQIQSEHFTASPAQFAPVTAAIVALIAAAFVIGRRPAPRTRAGVPRPWVVGAVAFAATSLYWTNSFLPGGPAVAWPVVGGTLVLVAGVGAVLTRWARRRDWGAAHRLALAGGALLTYVWVGFTQGGEAGVPSATAVVGGTVFGAAAIALLALAVRALDGRAPTIEAGSSDSARDGGVRECPTL